MGGRSNTPSNRIALTSSDPYTHERLFPLRTTVSPGISRGMNSSHHLSPGGAVGGNYRDMMTIRAVTPEDAEEEEDEDTDDSLAPQHSPTTPPRTPSHIHQKTTLEYGCTLGRESPEPAEPSSPRRRTHGHILPSFSDLSMRSKGRSPTDGGRFPFSVSSSDEKLLENPPSSATYHARQRLGATASPPTSTGYPSTTSPSPMNTKTPSKSTKTRFLRPQGSITTLHKPNQPIEPPVSPIQSTDVSRVLRLMKELRGRMEGHLEFKISENVAWNKGYCLINEDTGSLVHQKNESISSAPNVIIPDLRGCQVKAPTISEESDGIIEVLTHSSKLDIKLRPISPQQYDCWLAALLCWQPIRPAGAQNKMVKPHPPVLSQERKGLDRRRNSDASLPKDAAIIKVGKMLLWRRGGVITTPIPQTTSGKGSHRHSKGGHITWEKISCTLQENGEFRLYTEVDTTLLTVIQLSQLNRCAVQILDPSILDQDFCIAIYPQYTPSTSSFSLARPVYLAVDSRILFEVWFVLLRAFTMPELYGPAMPHILSNSRIPEGAVAEPKFDSFVPNALSDSYRIQRSLFLRVIEAKITGVRGASHGRDGNGGGGGSGGSGEKGDYDGSLSSSMGSHHSQHFSDFKEKRMDCYAEVVLDGEVRAKTMVRTKTHNPFWREDYEFGDLPAVLSDVAVVLKQRDPRSKKGSGSGGGPGSVTGSGGFGGGLGGASMPGSRDTVIGRVDIQLDELKMDYEMEGWWPLMSSNKGVEEKVGEMMLKIGLEELIVLMADEYRGLSELLYKFDNRLTHELAVIMAPDLRNIASTLLKIFQVAGKASEWLMALVVGELDGAHKNCSAAKLIREGSRENAGLSNSPAESTEVFNYPELSPDFNKVPPVKVALMDANILFRGNSLLTKALDAHMRRLGREYLEETLGPHLKKIADEDTYCEVDPVRIDRPEDLAKNWKTLLYYTRAIWQAIYTSPQRCPTELRRILKHIRACVDERYGDMLRSVVSYSSVSGFLFLRFFCPAVLNPKLFGLLKDHPGTRAQRTLTLIAKSLQGLANMTTFGVKEPWMEPMNEFLTEHTAEFKDFVDSVSNVPTPKYPAACVPPSYATPTTILARLSQSSREGFPSLPYLIDQPRAFASLVMMWDKWYPIHAARFPDHKLEGDLLKFHECCVNILERMRECVEKAENAERPNSSLGNRWEEVAEKVAATHIVGGGPIVYGPHPVHQYSNHHHSSGGQSNGISTGGSSKFGNTMKSHKILGVGVTANAASNGIHDHDHHHNQYQPVHSYGNFILNGGGSGMLYTSPSAAAASGMSSGSSGIGPGGGAGGGGIGGEFSFSTKSKLSEFVGGFGGFRKKVKSGKVVLDLDGSSVSSGGSGSTAYREC